MTSSSVQVLRSPDTTAGFAEWDKDVEFNKVTCAANPDHRRSGSRSGQLRVMLTKVPVADILWTWYSECIIQDRVLQSFRDEGFTGFDVKPVEARFKTHVDTEWSGSTNRGLFEEEVEEVEIPKLWELCVTGWGGMAPSESGVSLLKHCPGCGYYKYSSYTNPRKLVDESQWDGSDFFMVWPLPRFIFITNRVAQCIRDWKLSGMQLVSIGELATSSGSDTLTPGSLSLWMPKELARKYGEPLGLYF